MTKTVFKLTASWNYKKEETWLNEMSKKRLASHRAEACFIHFHRR